MCGMELPELFSNTRFIFANNVVADPMSFAIGSQSDPAMTTGQINSLMYSNFRDVFIATPASVLAGWRFVGTSTTRKIGGLPVVAERLESIIGTGAGDGLVCNTGLLVRKDTAAGGRKNRGRMFVPPFNLAESAVDVGGTVTASVVAGQQTGWNEFYTAIVAAEVPPWLLHSDPADSPTPISSFSVQSKAATQRRRIR
jgi:hypothetical protein